MRPLTDEERATVEANLRLAYRYGRRASKRYPWLDADDLIGASSEGLCLAVQNHRDDQGKLSTLAKFYMRKSVYRLMRESCVIVTPPWTWHRHADPDNEWVRQAQKVRSMERVAGASLVQLPECEPDDPSDTPKLDLALRSLRSCEREIVTRLIMHGEDRAKIAADLGKSIQTITNRRSQAVAELRRQMMA